MHYEPAYDSDVDLNFYGCSSCNRQPPGHMTVPPPPIASHNGGNGQI